MANEVKNTELVSLESQAKGEKAVKEEALEAKTKKASSSKKVKKNKVSLGRKLKGVFSELKKVSWPTLPKVVKQTGIVLAVVLFFLVIIGGFDFILTQLLSWLV